MGIWQLCPVSQGTCVSGESYTLLQRHHEHWGLIKQLQVDVTMVWWTKIEMRIFCVSQV